MKKLFTFIICLIVIVAFAANPTFQNFLTSDFDTTANTISVKTNRFLIVTNGLAKGLRVTNYFRVESPVTLYGSLGAAIGINTNSGPAVDDYNGLFRILSDTGGFRFMDKTASTNFFSYDSGAAQARLDNGYLVGNARPNAIHKIIRQPYFGYTTWFDCGGQCVGNGGVAPKESSITNTINIWKTNGILAAAQAVGRRPMMMIDDQWQGYRTGSSIVPNVTNFPSGFAWLCNFAHTNGFDIGIYDALALTLPANTCNGINATTTADQIHDNVVQFEQAGFDLVTIDGMGGDATRLYQTYCDEIIRGSSYRPGGGKIMQIRAAANNYSLLAKEGIDFTSEINVAFTGQSFLGGTTNYHKQVWIMAKLVADAQADSQEPGFSYETMFMFPNSTLTPTTNEMKMVMSVSAVLSGAGWMGMSNTPASYLYYYTNTDFWSIQGDMSWLPPSYTTNAQNATFIKPLTTYGSPSNAVCLLNWALTDFTATLSATNFGFPSGAVLQVRDIWAKTNFTVTNSFSFLCGKTNSALLLVKDITLSNSVAALETKLTGTITNNTSGNAATATVSSNVLGVLTNSITGNAATATLATSANAVNGVVTNSVTVTGANLLTGHGTITNHTFTLFQGDVIFGSGSWVTQLDDASLSPSPTYLEFGKKLLNGYGVMIMGFPDWVTNATVTIPMQLVAGGSYTNDIQTFLYPYGTAARIAPAATSQTIVGLTGLTNWTFSFDFATNICPKTVQITINTCSNGAARYFSFPGVVVYKGTQ